jgi:hypothetical protein
MNKLIKFSAIYALALSRNIYNFKSGAFIWISQSLKMADATTLQYDCVTEW